jgi:hypothetical protein
MSVRMHALSSATPVRLFDLLAFAKGCGATRSNGRALVHEEVMLRLGHQLLRVQRLGATPRLRPSCASNLGGIAERLQHSLKDMSALRAAERAEHASHLALFARLKQRHCDDLPLVARAFKSMCDELDEVTIAAERVEAAEAISARASGSMSVPYLPSKASVRPTAHCLRSLPTPSLVRANIRRCSSTSRCS